LIGLRNLAMSSFQTDQKLFPIPVIIINLDRRKDRLEEIKRRIQPFTSLPPEGPCSLFHPVYRLPAVSDPNHGCRLSHLKALHCAQEHDWPLVMVLEDDACFEEDETAFLEGLEALCRFMRSPKENNGTQGTTTETPNCPRMAFLGPGTVCHSDMDNHLLPLRRERQTTEPVPAYKEEYFGAYHMKNSENRFLTGSQGLLYNREIYASCIKLLESSSLVANLVHTDLILSQELPHDSVLFPVPYLVRIADDESAQKSDVRHKGPHQAKRDRELMQDTEKKLKALLFSSSRIGGRRSSWKDDTDTKLSSES